MKLQISLKATNLKNVAGLFKGTSDPYAILTITNTRTKQTKILGRTEVIKNNLNPNWTTSFIIDCNSDEYALLTQPDPIYPQSMDNQRPSILRTSNAHKNSIATTNNSITTKKASDFISIAVQVFDEVRKAEEDIPMGGSIFALSNVLKAKAKTKGKQLRMNLGVSNRSISNGSRSPSCGTLYLRAEEYEDTGRLTLQISANSLIKIKNLNNASIIKQNGSGDMGSTSQVSSSSIVSSALGSLVKKKPKEYFFQLTRVDIGPKYKGHERTVVYRSKEARHNPTGGSHSSNTGAGNGKTPLETVFVWEEDSIDLTNLCRGDLNNAFILSVYEYEKSGHHTLMGQIETTVTALATNVKNNAGGFVLHEGEKETGRITIHTASTTESAVSIALEETISRSKDGSDVTTSNSGGSGAAVDRRSKLLKSHFQSVSTLSSSSQNTELECPDSPKRFQYMNDEALRKIKESNSTLLDYSTGECHSSSDEEDPSEERHGQQQKESLRVSNLGEESLKNSSITTAPDLSIPILDDTDREGLARGMTCSGTSMISTIPSKEDEENDDTKSNAQLQSDLKRIRDERNSLFQNLNRVMEEHEASLKEKDDVISQLRQELQEIRQEKESLRTSIETTKNDQEALMKEKDETISQLRQEYIDSLKKQLELQNSSPDSK